MDTTSLTPCTTIQHNTSDAMAITGTCERGPIKQLREDNFMDYLRTQCVGEKWVCQNFTVNYDLAAIALSFKQGDSRAIYDGSFDHGYVTTAWCLEGEGNTIR